MLIGKAGDSLIIRLEAGDDILASLEAACVTHDIKNAEITGIGSVESLTLAHYRKDTKQFTEKKLVGIFEIAALTGNIGLVDGAPIAHCHVVVSDDTMATWGGHLKVGVCSATVELMVRPLGSAYKKILDETVGLNVWSLEFK